MQLTLTTINGREGPLDRTEDTGDELNRRRMVAARSCSRPRVVVTPRSNYRKAGGSYREIARQLGVDMHTAHADIAAELAALRRDDHGTRRGASGFGA